MSTAILRAVLVVRWPLSIISEHSLQQLIASLGSLVLFCACETNSAVEELNNSQIAYPFYHTNALGQDPTTSRDKFVIRTISGGTEYVVEIPGAAQDYDVEVPIAQPTGEGNAGAMRVKNAQLTDRELVASMPKLEQATEEERALMDRAYGVGERGGPRQAPSYTLGINKINQLYRQGRYELALVEINNLMAFYPTSVKLFKMKGTVLIKLRNYELAERAWLRAGDLAPQDAVIKKGLIRLRRRIENAAKTAAAPTAEANTTTAASDPELLKAQPVAPVAPVANGTVTTSAPVPP